MIQYERQRNILKVLEECKTSTMSKLAKAVFASESSVRRDVEELEKLGYVKRFYGGVVLTKYKNSIVPLEMRDDNNAKNKEYVAETAAALVGDGMTIIIDASSTAGRILKYINHRHELKIITNSQKCFQQQLSDDVEIYCTGGRYNPKNHVFVGPIAERFIETINADILFFSSQGISENGEITDVSEEETFIRKTMLKRSKRRVFLCDDSKIGVSQVFKVCDKNDVTDIICNVPLPWENTK